MPKYFEIPATGALLFAQETDDLNRLGFKDMDNCVVFNRRNFVKKVQDYLAAPERYLTIRERGKELIGTTHSLSVRLDLLEEHVLEQLK
jgi:spore maturation protein CgeB